MGFIYGSFGKDYSHSGIARLFTNIKNNGYKFVFLSSRPASHVGLLRNYISKVVQEDYSLPTGKNWLDY